ncbi:hypothetical protein TNIN_1961 [Trichonephila inaurata madagascariensis]|uniref:Uncharacterized protein n=1 Tax=Trichonephila inaurata madagascariensis TaxID=2747483 RepID=A0A8X6IJ11_9ARAC|nr:hypothetical protein TNIN_1961 [Trichonephila inaurata madagascariensis]
MTNPYVSHSHSAQRAEEFLSSLDETKKTWPKLTTEDQTNGILGTLRHPPEVECDPRRTRLGLGDKLKLLHDLQQQLTQ